MGWCSSNGGSKQLCAPGLSDAAVADVYEWAVFLNENHQLKEKQLYTVPAFIRRQKLYYIYGSNSDGACVDKCVATQHAWCRLQAHQTAKMGKTDYPDRC